MKKNAGLMFIAVVLVMNLLGCQRVEKTANESVQDINSVAQQEQKETMRKDLLFNTTTDEFIFIEANNLTIDGLNSTLESDLNNDGVKETFTIKLGTPNGMEILGVKGEYGINFLLPLNSKIPFENVGAFDEYGEPRENYYFQLTTYDLDQDGVKEVIVSVGDKLIDEETAIFKSTDSEDVPFQLIGSIQGQGLMYMDDNKIIVPFGSQGAAEIYLYDDDMIFTANQ